VHPRGSGGLGTGFALVWGTWEVFTWGIYWGDCPSNLGQASLEDKYIEKALI